MERPATSTRKAGLPASPKISTGLDSILERYRSHARLLRGQYVPLSESFRHGCIRSRYVHGLQTIPVIDATRLADGSTVALKIPQSAQEIKTLSYLNSPDRMQNPQNHTVPLLDYIGNKSEGEQDYIVMPLLRPFDNPPFEVVGEVLDFIGQTLEVLTPFRSILERE